ncbi:MAG: hypothetical protein ABI658_05315 [Acidimicrobiales bacterium]
MIPDQGDPQHQRYLVDGFFFSPLQMAIVFVERAIRGDSVEDLVTTQLFGDSLATRTAVPNRPTELNEKAKLLATAGPVTVTVIGRPVARTEGGVFDCRSVLGQAIVACTVDVARGASVSTVAVTLVGIDDLPYKISEFTKS